MPSLQQESNTRIVVSRKPDPRLEGDYRTSDHKWIMAQCYASHAGNDLLRAEDKAGEVMLLRSSDDGDSWREIGVIDRWEMCGDDRVRIPHVDIIHLDPRNGLLIMFISEFINVDTRGKTEYIELWADAEGMGPRTRRLFYQISRDGGRTWDKRRQIVQNGAEHNAEHWGRDLWYGKSSLCIEGRMVQTLADGTLVIPAYMWPTDEYIKRLYKAEKRPSELCDDARYFMESLCLLGRWLPDLGGLEWELGGPIRLSGGYTSAGTCGSDEPAIAYMDDGRWFAILRTSTSHVQEFRQKSIPAIRQCALSTDNGRTWKDARPLAFDDGSPVYSPSAFSELVRSSKNGNWYWIGNILDKPTYGCCDPRHPIQIAELDTKTLCLKRGTVAVIEDKIPQDPESVRFSNFRVYEERGTGDFILLMTKCYSEITPGFPNLPYPSYRYRISVPG